MKSGDYNASGKRGLFDEQFSIERLSATGNPLKKISKVVDFVIFRRILETKILNTEKKNNA
ncbi:hypothetical protein MASR2M12_05090 [Bacteroidales bacterium]